MVPLRCRFPCLAGGEGVLGHIHLGLKGRQHGVDGLIALDDLALQEPVGVQGLLEDKEMFRSHTSTDTICAFLKYVNPKKVLY